MARSGDDGGAGYFLEPAAAFARARLGCPASVPAEEAIALGLRAGLRLHPFKRTAGLSRVEKVLGILRGIRPARVLDVGSGRGTFLWPLLAAFPEIEVTAVDRDRRRIETIAAVARGGVTRLRAAVMDSERLAFPAGAFDAVTVLEVLEHVGDAGRAAIEAVRVSAGFVIVSVPSHPDDNPEHLRLLARGALMGLLDLAGARRVTLDAVHNHTIAIARVRRP